MTCGADASASACTTNDVVVGLSQLSVQLQGVSAFLFVVSCFVTLLLLGLVVLVFAAGRR